jgi:DNA-binding beta-propeller fold protein YncE
VIVTDTEGKRVLEYNTAGQFQGGLDAGPCGETGVDCTAGTGTVNKPYDVAIDKQGNFYVSEFVIHLQLGSVLTPRDFGANRVQKFDANGSVLFQLGTAGSNVQFGINEGSPVGTGDGDFDSPLGIALDSKNNLYVVDSNNNRVQKFNKRGKFLLKWGTAGIGPGQFDIPIGIAIDDSNNVYVTDHEGNRIQKFNSSGTFLTSWTTDPLPSTETLSVNEVGNYWGRNCGLGNVQGPPLMQPGIDSNQLDLEDLFAFKHPVASVDSDGLNAAECPTAN